MERREGERMDAGMLFLMPSEGQVEEYRHQHHISVWRD
jgi:hypothetical protein